MGRPPAPSVTTNYTYTLACDGAGGSVTRSVSLTVTVASGSSGGGGGGGGGSLDLVWLLALSALLRRQSGGSISNAAPMILKASGLFQSMAPYILRTMRPFLSTSTVTGR